MRESRKSTTPRVPPPSRWSSLFPSRNTNLDFRKKPVPTPPFDQSRRRTENKAQSQATNSSTISSAASAPSDSQVSNITRDLTATNHDQGDKSTSSSQPPSTPPKPKIQNHILSRQPANSSSSKSYDLSPNPFEGDKDDKKVTKTLKQKKKEKKEKIEGERYDAGAGQKHIKWFWTQDKGWEKFDSSSSLYMHFKKWVELPKSSDDATDLPAKPKESAPEKDESSKDGEDVIPKTDDNAQRDETSKVNKKEEEVKAPESPKHEAMHHGLENSVNIALDNPTTSDHSFMFGIARNFSLSAGVTTCST